MNVCMCCICVYVGISGQNYFKGRECKTQENFIFSEKWQNGNFVEIVQATWKFSRSRMMK